MRLSRYVFIKMAWIKFNAAAVSIMEIIEYILAGSDSTGIFISYVVLQKETILS